MSENALSEKQWAMICHLGAFAGYVVPFGNIIVPLVIWSLKRNESAIIDKAGKESVNFQISITLYILVSIILIFLIIGIFLIIALFMVNVILVIIAAIKADKGETYEYPMSIKFIS